jgi:hypothetical protein
MIESEPEDSLDDEDAHVTTNGASSSIAQNATQLSSDSVGGHSRIAALRTGAETKGGATVTFAYFPFGAANNSALGLFPPAPILIFPAFGTNGIVALFCTTAFMSTPAFGGALAFGAASAFIRAALDEAAFKETTFDGAAFDEVAPGRG